MTDRATGPTRPTQPPRTGSAIAASWIAAAVGAAGLVAGLALDARRAWFAYLMAWTFLTSLCIGGLLFLMVGHAAKASWMVVTRRASEAVASALWLCAILFVPIVIFGLRYLYPWAADPAHVDPALVTAIAHKRAYLAPRPFVIRAAVYFAIFIAVAAFLRRWSLRNDADPSLARVIAMRRLGGGGLPFVAMAITWASFDWVMSLEPDWSSTIFGLYFFSGAFIGGIAIVTLMVQAPPPLARGSDGREAPITADHRQALGRVLFAMVIFWAYMAFSQLLIDWIGDLPEEATFYFRREHGIAGAESWILGFGHFAIPFLVLLSRPLKRRRDGLAISAVWMLAMHLVDVDWLILPSATPRVAILHWTDAAALVFVLGAAAGWVISWHARAPALPRHAPELAAGLDYEASL